MLYHHIKFQFFHNKVHKNNHNAQGATNIQEGEAFSGSVAIDIIPHPTWNKEFHSHNKITDIRGCHLNNKDHRITIQHQEIANNFGHSHLSSIIQNIIWVPKASILYVKIAKNIHSEFNNQDI